MSIVGPRFSDFDIIRRSVFSEKSSLILSSSGAYVFIVDKSASKVSIKDAIERVFSVKVESVNTLVVKGKNKVFRGIRGRRSDYKKAIVKVGAGGTIDLGVGV
jgi:large subunit ribosomal protein L23